MKQHYDSEALAQIDNRFPEILASIGWKPTKRTAQHLAGACPIHAGTHSNFHLDRLPDGKWLATCRSQCGGEGWTATRFLAAYLGITHPEAIAKAAEITGVSPTEGTPAFTRRRHTDHHAAGLREQEAEETRKREITQAITSRRDSLLSPHLRREWHHSLWESSPIIIPHELHEQAHLVARHLFHPEEIVWMGDMTDSGQPHHAAHFRPREDWQKETHLPPRMAPGTFHPGTTSRGNEGIATAPFIVIESDDIIGKKPETPEEQEENRRLSAALITFIQERLALTLRAVIDTGNKSLHAYYDRPAADILESFTRYLVEGFSIDTGVITSPADPLRLPGCIHATTGQPARLCYLNPRSF